VSSTLNDLDSFLKRIEPGIEAITGEEQDIASFMRLMRVFNEVRSLSQQQHISQGDDGLPYYDLYNLIYTIF